MNNKQKEWDFSLLLKEVDSKDLEKEKEEIKEKVDNFATKWKEKDFLRDEKILKRALDDY